MILVDSRAQNIGRVTAQSVRVYQEIDKQETKQSEPPGLEVTQVAGLVEKLNPKGKGSALSRKRDAERGTRRGKTVEIREITLEEVRADAVRFRLATDVAFQIKAGKEASIYLAYWKEYPIILKAYRLWQSAQARKKRGFFAPGRMEALAAKEFDILHSCFRAGMSVPTPVGRVGNYLTMRFVGDGVQPAPQLREAEFEDPESVLEEILEQYLVMYRDVQYVHGDLSAYNILWWHGHPWIIDVPQAYRVGPWADMNVVKNLLRRDIWNVLSFFKKHGVTRDADEVLRVFLGAYVPRNLRHFEETIPFKREGAP
ncbi:MAG: RIO1 family regulatory kinase/ATPase domain-containing protein [Candidatus Thorarchaeota archaeon]